MNWNGSQRRSEPKQISFVSNSIPHSDKNWSNKKFVRIQNHKQASESRDAFVAAFNHPLYSQRKKNTRVKKRNEEREREKRANKLAKTKKNRGKIEKRKKGKENNRGERGGERKRETSTKVYTAREGAGGRYPVCVRRQETGGINERSEQPARY